LKEWLPDAVRRWPRPDGVKDYAGYLQKRAPKAWEKHTIQTALSELARETGKKKLSRKVNAVPKRS
jgi:hypothetical protein